MSKCSDMNRLTKEEFLAYARTLASKDIEQFRRGGFPIMFAGDHEYLAEHDPELAALFDKAKEAALDCLRHCKRRLG